MSVRSIVPWRFDENEILAYVRKDLADFLSYYLTHDGSTKCTCVHVHVYVFYKKKVYVYVYVHRRAPGGAGEIGAFSLQFL